MIEKILTLLRTCFLFLPVVDQPELCGIDGAPGINGPVGVARERVQALPHADGSTQHGGVTRAERAAPTAADLRVMATMPGTGVVLGLMLNDAADALEVLDKAHTLVALPPPEYGYSDVGDVLVSYLRGEATAEQALDTLDGLAIDFARARARSKT